MTRTPFATGAVMLDVVDLGTKRGGAIVEFLRRAGETVLPSKEVASYAAERCIGYERREGAKYRAAVRQRGYQFDFADLNDAGDLDKLPKAKVYLAWHVLEHLADKECAGRAVAAALTQAERLAWFRLPSFEQDCERGEGALRRHGLRFSWTRWSGHPTAWLVSDCKQAIEDWRLQYPDRVFDVIIRPAAYVRDTEHPRVLPIDAAVNADVYDESFGLKPARIVFDPPLVSEWEVIVKFRVA